MISKRAGRSVYGISAALLAFSINGCSTTDHPAGPPASTLATPVATVNNSSITTGDYLVELQAYVPNPQTANLGYSTGKAVLSQMLQDQIVLQLAAKENVTPTDDQLDAQYADAKLLQESQIVEPMEQALADHGMTADQFKELRIKPQLAQFNLLTQGLTVQESDITSFYDQNKATRFTESDRAYIKRIAFRTQPEAQDVYNQIKDGDKMFEAFIGQSAVKNPPDAKLPNWIPTDPKLDPRLAPLCKAIQATEIGTTSPPFFFQGGWWLVKVIDRKPLQVLPLSTVHHLIQSMLLEQKSQDPNRISKIQADLQAFESAAQITVANPAYSDVVDDIKASGAAPAPGRAPTQ